MSQLFGLGKRYLRRRDGKIAVLHDVVDGYPVLYWVQSGRTSTKHPMYFWREFTLMLDQTKEPK